MIGFLLAMVAIADASFAASDPPGEQVVVERQVARLHLQIAELKKAADWSAAETLIREMAALDAGHPKPYLEAAVLFYLRGAADEARPLMDRLGPRNEPGRLFGEGLIRFLNNQDDAALGFFEQALTEYRERGHLAGQATSLTLLGNLHRRNGRLEAATAHYESVPALLERLENRVDLPDAYSNLARMERTRDRPARAAALEREVLAVRRQLGDENGEARSLHAIGVSLTAAGDPTGAIEALSLALEIRRELGDGPAQLTTLQSLAETHRAADDRDEALVLVDEALELVRSIGPQRREAEVLRQRGNLCLEVGRDEDALGSFKTAAGLYGELGRSDDQATLSSWIGTALNRLGRYHEARRVLDEVVVAARESGNPELEAAALTELGLSLFSTGEIPAAFLTQERALDLNRDLGDVAGMLTNHNNLGGIHHAIGSPRANDEIELAFELATEIGDPRLLARAHHNVGVLRLERLPVGDLGNARRELEAAAQIWNRLGERRELAHTLASLAEVEARRGRVDRAQQRIEEALGILRDDRNRRGQALVLNVQGKIRRRVGRPLEAADSYRGALTIAREQGFSGAEWRALDGLSRAEESAGRADQALESALETLDAVERARRRLEIDTFKVRFLAGRQELYERAIKLLLSAEALGPSERTARAFEVAERARARGLLDLLVEGRVHLRDRIAPDLREREDATLDALGAAYAHLAAAEDGAQRTAARAELHRNEAALRRLQVEIRLAVPAYGVLAYPAPSGLDEIRGMLRPDEILLEYFVGESKSWVWVVDRNGARVQELHWPGRDIEDRLREAVERLGDPRGGLDGERLASRILEELASRLLPEGLTESGRVIVVPDGVLHGLPFELLPYDDELLIERYEVAVVPSASTLKLLRGLAESPGDLEFLGVGAPTLGSDSLPPLPFARQEIERIASLFPQSRRHVLIGSDATKRALDESDLTGYRFVHFATHGWLLEDRRESGLRLSGGKGDPDSLLTVAEILGLRLSADLVVLSACRSGLGPFFRGEGLVSMTRAFLYAGARSVVVSLWEVSDESTASFMEAFYRELLRGRSAAAALRQAKLGFLHSDRPARRRPYRWASFLLVGEPGVDHTGPATTMPEKAD